MALIIDGSAVKNLIVYGNNYKQQIIDNPDVFSHGFLDYILQMTKKFSCNNSNNKCYIAVDRKGKFVDAETHEVSYNYWRQKFYDSKIMTNPSNNFSYYKCNRAIKKDDGVDWVRINELYDNLLEILNKYTDIIVLEFPYLEADDIAAIIVQSDKHKDEENIILTHDHDLNQLINSKVKIYNPFKREIMVNGMSEFEKTIFYLCGCDGDSVPPVLERVKEKKWAKKLDEKDLETIFNESTEPLRERYIINKKIMNLDIENIPHKLVDKVLEYINSKQDIFNEMNLRRNLKKYELSSFVEEGCKSVYDRIKEFKLPDTIKSNNNPFNMKERRKEKIESMFDSN